MNAITSERMQRTLDRFAAAALSGMLADSTIDMPIDQYAERAYNIAAAMIAVRNKRDIFGQPYGPAEDAGISHADEDAECASGWGASHVLADEYDEKAE